MSKYISLNKQVRLKEAGAIITRMKLAGVSVQTNYIFNICVLIRIC